MEKVGLQEGIKEGSGFVVPLREFYVYEYCGINTEVVKGD